MEQASTFRDKFESLRISQMVIRLIASMSIFTITVFFTPNFNISSFPILVLSSFTITIFDYLMSVITGIHDMPLGRGFVGFTCAAIIIYITQFFVDGYYISIMSSLIAAAIYGVIDSLLPNRIV
ncbi:MAG: phage holin family protein [Clostridia bacterium]|nr:phage holin family protein [Clostridia bacterium]